VLLTLAELLSHLLAVLQLVEVGRDGVGASWTCSIALAIVEVS
jgi:hypothetical protein